MKWSGKLYFGIRNESELLANTGFETAGAGGEDVFGTWVEYAPGTGTVEDETVDIHGGSHAAQCNSDASDDAIIYQDDIAVTPGHACLLSFWTHGDGQHCGRYYAYDLTHSAFIVPDTAEMLPGDLTNVYGSAYELVTAGFRVPAGCTTVRIGLLAPGIPAATIYFDDVSLIDVDDIAWTECEDVLLDQPVEWEYGFAQGSPLDLLASTGRLSFLLDNSDQNSAGLAGLYSPENANLLAGFAEGTLVKLELAEDDMTTILLTGWITPDDTWTYASATTFTVVGDQTARFRKGTKIKLTQTTDKYFYVVSSSYGAPNTTVTITGGSDYSLANAAITSPRFSYILNPEGFPAWFNWTPALTGFSADPTNAVYRFCMIGGTVFLKVRQGTAGTSNATTFTVGLPITASSITNDGQWGTPGFYVDNGVTKTGGAVGISAVANTIANCYTDDLGVWTGSGSKRIAFMLAYEAA